MKNRWAIVLLFQSSLLLAQHPFNVIREEVKVPMRDGVKLGAHFIQTRPGRKISCTRLPPRLTAPRV